MDYHFNFTYIWRHFDRLGAPIDEINDREGRVLRVVARVNTAVCEGCGVCTVTCRSGNIDLEGCTDEQVFAQLGALGPVPEGVKEEASIDERAPAERAQAG